MKKLILSFLLTFSLNVFADGIISENIIQSPIIISANQSQFISTGRNYYINHLIINAEGVARDSMIEVIVNGVVKGTIYAPGRDPEYVVTVREVTGRIELRYKSGASMRILSLTIYRSEDGYEPGTIGHSPLGKAAVAQVAMNVINLTRKFESVLSTKDFEAYILPVKIVAGQLYAISSAHGDSSMKTMEKFQALHFSMGLAIGFIDELLRSSKTFDMAVNYLELREKIKEMMD